MVLWVQIYCFENYLKCKNVWRIEVLKFTCFHGTAYVFSRLVGVHGLQVNLIQHRAFCTVSFRKSPKFYECFVDSKTPCQMHKNGCKINLKNVWCFLSVLLVYKNTCTYFSVAFLFLRSSMPSCQCKFVYILRSKMFGDWPCFAALVVLKSRCALVQVFSCFRNTGTLHFETSQPASGFILTWQPSSSNKATLCIQHVVIFFSIQFSCVRRRCFRAALSLNWSPAFEYVKIRETFRKIKQIEK